MIKAISYWAFKDGMANTHPIDLALKEAKEAGFAGLELSIGTGGVLHTESSDADCAKIRKQIDASGVAVETCAAGLTWGCNPTSEDAAIRKKAIAQHAGALRVAGKLGAKSMLMVPGVVKSPISPDIVRYDKALERCREAIKQLLDVAAEAKVELCIENVWNGMFYSPVELAAFHDSFGNHPNLGIYFDVGNVMGYHQHPPHWIELLGKRIKRVHVKDYNENFNWTGGYAFCALGAGQVPWAETMKALRAVGYNRTLVAELMPWDPGNVIRTSVSLDVIMKM